MGKPSPRTADAFPVVATTGNASAVRRLEKKLTYKKVQLKSLLLYKHYPSRILLQVICMFIKLISFIKNDRVRL